MPLDLDNLTEEQNTKIVRLKALFSQYTADEMCDKATVLWLVLNAPFALLIIVSFVRMLFGDFWWILVMLMSFLFVAITGIITGKFIDFCRKVDEKLGWFKK